MDKMFDRHNCQSPCQYLKVLSAKPLWLVFLILGMLLGGASWSHASLAPPLINGSDTIPPSITCPPNVFLANDSAACGAIATWAPPTATDNCCLLSVTGSANSGDFFPIDSNIVVYIALDSAGNSDTCSFAVVVTDTFPPQIACPPDFIFPNDSGACGAFASWAIPAITDNCGIDTVITQVVNGAFYPVGEFVILYLANDVNGLSNACDIGLFIVDVDPPSITCPPNVATVADQGACGAVITWAASSASDNCGIDTIVGTAESGDFFPIGLTTVTRIAIDPAGNVDSCSFAVNVSDTVDPVLLCPPPISVGTDPGLCGAIVNWAPVTASDDCGIVSLAGNAASGDFFLPGSYSLGFTATDSSGNSAACTFSVTVADGEAPSLQCPQDTAFVADSLTCSATVGWNAPLISDNCSLDTVWSNVQPGASLPAGSYVVTYHAIDSAGNADSCSFNLDVNASPLNLVLTPVVQTCGFTVTCNGGNDGAASAFVSGGCPPYSISWSNGETGASASSLAAGTVLVTVTDAGGQTTQESIVVTQPPALNLFLALVGLVCQGDSTGSINLSVTGGNACGGYTYAWSNGATTEDISQVTPGLYAVTVTDTLGCMATGDKEIVPQPLPMVNLGPDKDICPGDQATLNAGAGQTAYLWSTGATSQTISVGQPGTYAVTVTGPFGCVNSDAILVGLYVLEDSVISPREDLVICQGDSVELEAEMGFSAYFWSNGDLGSSTVVSGAGGYVGIEVLDANGCTVLDSVLVTFNDVAKPSPMVMPGDFNLCDGAEAQVALGGVFVDYAWNTGATTATATVNAGGLYWAEVTDSLGCEGISDTILVTTVPNPQPSIVFQNDTLFAVGSYVTYQWLRNGSAIQTATQPFFRPLVPASYALVVTDANGCEGTSDTLFVEPFVAVGEALEDLLGLELYPNPARESLYLAASSPKSGGLELAIVDLQGRDLRHFSIQNLQAPTALDVSGLAAGIYFLRIKDKKERSGWLRFVVQ